LDLKDVNIYYGSFQAVADVTLSILPRSVTAFIGASGCGKTTVLRTLNRMHEVIPGARVEGTVLLDDENIYAAGIDPVGVRRAIGMVFHPPSPRNVSPGTAEAILSGVPAFVTPVGLFVDAPVDEVAQICRRLRLNCVQLHGHETPETAARIMDQTGASVRMRANTGNGSSR